MERIFGSIPKLLSRIESKPLIISLPKSSEDAKVKPGDTVMIRTEKYEFSIKVKSISPDRKEYFGFVQSVKGRSTLTSNFFSTIKVGYPVSFSEANIFAIFPQNERWSFCLLAK